MKSYILDKVSPTAKATALLVFGFALMLSYSSTAAIAIFQVGRAAPSGGSVYTNCEDTFLADGSPGQSNQNYGARSTFTVGEGLGGGRSPRRALLRFDVTSFAGQFLTVSNITLRLFVTEARYANSGDTLEAFSLAAANADWIEGTGVNFTNNEPDDVGMSTWSAKVQGSANWAGSAGASTEGVDFIATPLAASHYTSNITVGSYIDLIFTNSAFFLDWVAGTNPGLLLSTASQSNSALYFASSQSETVEWRPQLIVIYEPPPETNMLSVRVSQVELCWETLANHWYQLQYQSTLTTNLWTPLDGTWLAGTGARYCTNDIVRIGEPQRFYRFTATNTPPQQ